MLSLQSEAKNMGDKGRQRILESPKKVSDIPTKVKGVFTEDGSYCHGALGMGNIKTL